MTTLRLVTETAPLRAVASVAPRSPVRVEPSRSPLRSERLTLRPYRRADFEPYLAFWQSDRTRHMGGPLEAAGAWAWFTSEIASWPLYGFGTLAIDRDGAMIGFAGLVHPPTFPEPECGWGLFEGSEGQGYATEAAAAMLHHTFASTELASVVSYIDRGNARSIALAERLGGVVDPDAPSIVLLHRGVLRGWIDPANGTIQGDLDQAWLAPAPR